MKDGTTRDDDVPDNTFVDVATGTGGCRMKKSTAKTQGAMKTKVDESHMHPSELHE